MENIWALLTFAVLIIGTLGTLLPLLPGLALMAIAVIAYGWYEGFVNVNTFMIIITLVLAAVGMLLDYVVAPYTAKRTGASKAGVWGALLGGFFGIFILGPFGLFIGPFIGAMAGELLFGKKLSEASKTGLATVIGILIGNFVKFAFALIITTMFFFQVIL